MRAPSPETSSTACSSASPERERQRGGSAEGVRSGAVPAWLGWLAIAAGVASVATVAFVGIFAWMAWIAGASLVLLVGRRA